MKFNEAMNVSLLGLSLSDLIGLLFLQWVNINNNPFFIRADAVPFYPIDFQYFTGGWPHLCFSRITLLITVFVAIERCLCITMPLQVKTILTPRRVLIIIVCIYTVVILTLVPAYVEVNIDWKFIPERNLTLLGIIWSPGNRFENISLLLNLILQLLFFLAILSANAMLVYKLHKKTRWRHKTLVECAKSARGIKLEMEERSTAIPSRSPSEQNMLEIGMAHSDEMLTNRSAPMQTTVAERQLAGKLANDPELSDNGMQGLASQCTEPLSPSTATLDLHQSAQAGITVISKSAASYVTGTSKDYHDHINKEMKNGGTEIHSGDSKGVGVSCGSCDDVSVNNKEVEVTDRRDKTSLHVSDDTIFSNGKKDSPTDQTGLDSNVNRVSFSVKVDKSDKDMSLISPPKNIVSDKGGAAALRSRNRDRRLGRMILFLSIILVVCYLPSTVCIIIMLAEPKFSIKGAYTNAFFVSWGFAWVSDAINSSVNIFVYYHMSSRYRETFRKTFLCCFRENRKVSPQSFNI